MSFARWLRSVLRFAIRPRLLAGSDVPTVAVAAAAAADTAAATEAPAPCSSCDDCNDDDDNDDSAGRANLRRHDEKCCISCNSDANSRYKRPHDGQDEEEEEEELLAETVEAVVVVVADAEWAVDKWVDISTAPLTKAEAAGSFGEDTSGRPAAVAAVMAAALLMAAKRPPLTFETRNRRVEPSLDSSPL